MPTAAQYQEAFKRLAFFIASARRFNYLGDVTARYGTKIWTILSGAEMFDWAFTGVKRGENTDADGKLYAELVDLGAPGGPYQVEVFKDAAKAPGDLVASGSVVLTSGTVTLVEQNNSGLTGTVYITWTVDDTACELILDVAWPKYIDSLVKSDSDKDLADSKSDMDTATQNTLEGYFGDLGSMRAALSSVLDSNFWLDFIAKLIESGEAGVWTPTQIPGTNGEIIIEYLGVMKDFIDEMTADTEDVLENATIVVGIISAVGTPSGAVGTVSNLVWPYVRNETFKIKCNKTLDSTLETFRIIGGVSGQAENFLTLNAVFKSLGLGIANLLLKREPTTTSASLTVISMTGEQLPRNVASDGKIYTRLTNPSGTTYNLEIFNHPSRLDEYKVAEGSRVGNGVIVAYPYGGSGLEVTATLVWVGAEDAEIDLKVCQVNDTWEYTVTNTEDGLFLNMIGRMYPGAVLPNAAVPTIDDKLAIIPMDELHSRFNDGWWGLD